MEGQKEFFQIDQNDLFPYLLVNIGSGVSMIKVQYFCPLFIFPLLSLVIQNELGFVGNFMVMIILSWYRLMEMGNFSELVEQMLVVVLIGAWESC